MNFYDDNNLPMNIQLSFKKIFRDIIEIVMVLTWVIFMTTLGQGCGGSSASIVPNYTNQHLSRSDLKRNQLVVKAVIDNRNSDAHTIGKAYIGFFQKEEPYLMADSVSVFVQRIFDSLVVTPDEKDNLLPVIILIDMFLVKEEIMSSPEYGSFMCRLRFGLQTSDDSLLYYSVHSVQIASNLTDVTPLLEELVYKGTVECVEKFIHNIFDKLILIRTKKEN